MYNFIKGKIAEKLEDKNLCVLDVNGIGFEIIVADSTLQRVNVKDETKFYLVEVAGGLYGSGLPTLYGFLSREEKEIFLTFKDNLSNVGPKKALDYLDKVTKNITEFRRAVVEKNYKILTSLFGFRQSSAEKIVSSLSSVKDFQEIQPSSVSSINIDVYSDIVSALVNLGYKEHIAQNVTENILKKNKVGDKVSSEKISELLRIAIKEISLLENK